MAEEAAAGQLIAGFDAGQTHTTCRLARSGDGAIVAEGQGPGVCHLAAPSGDRRFSQALVGSLADALANLPGDGRTTAALRAAAVGASGIEQGSAVQVRGTDLAAAALVLPPARVLVCGDERTALRGAFTDGSGIVLISGTGSIAVGRDRQGREHRCGGWGWLLDGAGSAMDIGRDGLALTLRMADGRHPATALLPSLWQALGVDPGDAGGPQAIKSRVGAEEFGAAGFAALAPQVAAPAAAGDHDCRRILADSARALATMAAAVAAGLGLPPAVRVCAVGGAITHLPGLAEALEDQLVRALPGARLVAAQADACAGALRMAAELAAHPAAG
ncbi:MAG: BadF/BadG/BcrA/BcrD ATPase family protein [Cyanobacteriota bacterium]